MAANAGLDLNNSYLYNTGLNTGLTTGNVSSTGLNTGLFGTNLQAIDTNYNDDIMMPDFLKTTTSTFQTAAQNTGIQTQYPQYQSAQYQNQSIFTGNQNLASQSENQVSDQKIKEFLMSQDSSIKMSQNGNLYKGSTTFTKLGATAGIIAPVVKAASKGLKSLFNKNLLVKVPLIGIAGYALGSLADKFINSYRAKQVDKV